MHSPLLPCCAVDAVVGALADGDTAHDFLGPVQPDAVMQKVAEGNRPALHSRLKTRSISWRTDGAAMTAISTVMLVFNNVMQSSCHEASAPDAML